MIMRGAGLKDVQEILGHKTMTMTMRYAHLSQEHKRKAVNLINDLTAPHDPSNNKRHKSVTSCDSAKTAVG
jgi:site-specific recombinase XerC